MARRRPGPARRLSRAYERVFEAVSARPLSLLVFAGSVALLVWLQGSSLGRFQARAVAHARVVEHPALVASFVQKTFVQSGDRVEEGAPLIELSPYFVERELSRVDAEIKQLLNEAALAKARLMVEEQRWLEAPLRTRPGQPSLQRPTEELYAAQLQLLRTRRSLLVEDQHNLTVTSHASGRVFLVKPEGSPVAIGTSVATVTPEHAEEIIAYVPADTEPATIAPGVGVVLASPRTLSCTGLGTVLRRGAAVAQAPDQITGFLRFPVYGLPVYISVPDGCRLGVGQLLTVEFPKANT